MRIPSFEEVGNVTLSTLQLAAEARVVHSILDREGIPREVDGISLTLWDRLSLWASRYTKG